MAITYIDKDGLTGKERHYIAANKWRSKNRERANETQRKRRSKNPDKHRERARAYRAKNPERARELHRAWVAKNPERARELARASARVNAEKKIEARRNGRANCSDSYIKRLLTDRTTLRASDIPAELVEAKRVHLKTLRLLKEQENEKHG